MRHQNREGLSSFANMEITGHRDDRAGGDGISPVVLVIEDDLSVRAALCSLLADAGYRVTAWSAIPLDGMTAEVALTRPDLIILDVIFDGEAAALPFLAQLAADPRSAEVPVLLCTAAIDRVREAGDRLTGQVAGIIAKPFDADDLLRTVAVTLAATTSTAGGSRAVPMARR